MEISLNNHWFRETLIILAVLGLASCDGPHEKAGRETDRAAAAANGQGPIGDGPNERLGEAQDRAETAAREAQEARATAFEKRADQIRREADARAEPLDEQARAIREDRK